MGDIQVWRAQEGRNLIQRPENPAKKLLSSYRYLVLRCRVYAEERAENYAKATSCTTRLNPEKASGGKAAYDRMASYTIKAADAESALADAEAQLNARAPYIISLIHSVPDELQKLILELRYLQGMGWPEICERIHYEKTQTHKLHGLALLAVNRLMHQPSKKTREELETEVTALKAQIRILFDTLKKERTRAEPKM